MEPFTTHTGRIAPLDRVNVDTDQIIPKRYLKTVHRTGLKEGLFADWRTWPDGSPNPDFFMNQPRYAGATILLTRDNFGCGSSREHAPWALLDYGIRVILAPSFADIFYNNCLQNSILPVVLTHQDIQRLFDQVQADDLGHPCHMTIDLASQTVSIPTSVPWSHGAPPGRPERQGQAGTGPWSNPGTGIPAVTLPRPLVARSARGIHSRSELSGHPGGEVSPATDLDQGTQPATCTVAIDPFRKQCLLQGIDEIGLTLRREREIADYESRGIRDTPWLFQDLRS